MDKVRQHAIKKGNNELVFEQNKPVHCQRKIYSIDGTPEFTIKGYCKPF